MSTPGVAVMTTRAEEFHAARELARRGRVTRFGGVTAFQRAIGDLASVIRERGRCPDCGWRP